jgi:NADH-quinone oxidoreductase subunit L
MSDPQLWLIPTLPLAASVLTAFFGPRFLRRQSHWPCILAVVASCVLSLNLLGTVAGRPADEPIQLTYYTWFSAGSADVSFTLRADALTAVMLATVTFVGSFIAIFAVGYMSHERDHNAGYARFFAEVALFIFSMTGLVLADNYIVVYAFWEGVGVCSYLLIGFWFEKPSAAAAARKAFLVTRIGDVGMIIGIILMWANFVGPDGGRLFAFDFDTLFKSAEAQNTALVAAVCLLLLCGAVGKSAQFPLYVWLPDAMEGPTPVSALIHAATMVTAGVYLVARSMPLFQLVPGVLLVVACIGAFTALLAALIALTQNDLKRVLAYSTISQIGYMFLALGSAPTENLVVLAVVAAMFHLMTHAFFKALLFLSAGSVMHSMGGVIDMRQFSGLRKVLPYTHWTFLCGACALAALFPTSGFWSKDDILGVTWMARDSANGTIYFLCFAAGLLTAALTAFYTFRAYFLTFWGELKTPPEAGHHVHESPPVMWVPLVVLAVGAVFLGMIVEPMTHMFSHFLEKYWAVGQKLPEPREHHANLVLMSVSTLFAVGGVGVAWWMYVREPGFADRLAASARRLYELSLHKFFVDELYYAVLVWPLNQLANLGRLFDQYVVDGIVDLVGLIPSLIGGYVRWLQNGLVQFYALATILFLTVILGALIVRGM